MTTQSIFTHLPHTRIEGEGKRVAYIDTVKGLLFVFVCLGHYTYLPEWLRAAGNYMLIFRIPAYFFLSGMLFSSRRHNTLRKYVVSKTRSLLIPYLLLSLLFTLCDYEFLRNPGQTILINLDWMFLRGQGVPKAVALWFVLTLYFASIAYYIIDRHLKSNGGGKLLLAVVISVLGIVLSHYGINYPLKIGTFCAALVFFTMGHLATKLKTVSFRWSTGIILLITMLYGIAFACSHYGISHDRVPYIVFNKLYSYGIFYAGALSGTIATILLFNLLDRYKSVVFLLLQYVARNALVILATHTYLILLLTHVCREYVTTNPTLNFLFVTALLIPIEIAAISFFNRYLYRLIGKKKQYFRASLRLKTE